MSDETTPVASEPPVPVLPVPVVTQPTPTPSTGQPGAADQPLSVPQTPAPGDAAPGPEPELENLEIEAAPPPGPDVRMLIRERISLPGIDETSWNDNHMDILEEFVQDSKQLLVAYTDPDGNLSLSFDLPAPGSFSELCYFIRNARPTEEDLQRTRFYI